MRRMTVILIALIWANLLAAQPERVYRSLEEVTDPAEVYQLELHRKHLRRIPAEVYQMTNLKRLDLRGNRISELSDSIVLLKNLERLELSRNPLHTLPVAMGRMDSLRQLVLWQTYITELPPEFETLDGTLESIDLRKCPLRPTDQEAISQLLPTVEKIWDFACNCGD